MAPWTPPTMTCGATRSARRPICGPTVTRTAWSRCATTSSGSSDLVKGLEAVRVRGQLECPSRRALFLSRVHYWRQLDCGTDHAETTLLVGAAVVAHVADLHVGP